MKKGRWIKERKRPCRTARTEQQKKIGEVGKKIKEKCTGLKDKEFHNCRREIIEMFYPPKKEA